MQHPLSATPALITPPPLSPAATDEPGATPMDDDDAGTPSQTRQRPGAPGSAAGASGAPFAQAKRAGLHRALLEASCRGAAARAAHVDLVPLSPSRQKRASATAVATHGPPAAHYAESAGPVAACISLYGTVQLPQARVGAF